MDIQSYKYSLIEQLIKVQDVKLLEKIAAFLQKENNDALNKSLEQGLQDVKDGKVKPHQEVMQELRKKYS